MQRTSHESFLPAGIFSIEPGLSMAGGGGFRSSPTLLGDWSPSDPSGLVLRARLSPGLLGALQSADAGCSLSLDLGACSLSVGSALFPFLSGPPDSCSSATEPVLLYALDSASSAFLETAQVHGSIDFLAASPVLPSNSSTSSTTARNVRPSKRPSPDLSSASSSSSSSKQPASRKGTTSTTSSTTTTNSQQEVLEEELRALKTQLVRLEERYRYAVESGDTQQLLWVSEDILEFSRHGKLLDELPVKLTQYRQRSAPSR